MGLQDTLLSGGVPYGERHSAHDELGGFAGRQEVVREVLLQHRLRRVPGAARHGDVKASELGKTFGVLQARSLQGGFLHY